MENKTYDKLKFITQIILPALGTLYFALAQIWRLPLSEEVVGTITVVITFLGTILQISSSNYNKTNILVDDIKILDNLKEEKLEIIIENSNTHLSNHEVKDD